MPYNRTSAPPVMISFADSLVGRVGYSEESPENSFADGHLWYPGDTIPVDADCSGGEIMVCRFVGITVSNGNANTIYNEFRAVWLTATEPLQGGDFGAFMGAPGVQGYAGHTAMVRSCDNATGQGFITGPYDSQMGWCTLPFDRWQKENLGNGLGVIGFYRPVNTLSIAPPPPPPVPPPVFHPAPLAAHKYAASQGMVVIDIAEAGMAITAGISYYVWANNSMRGSRSPDIIVDQTLFAFSGPLNAHGIPHAGA